MPDQEIKLVITTDATGAISGVKRVGDEVQKMESSTGGWVGKIKEHWLGLTAVFAGVGLAAHKAHEYMELGAKALQVEKGYENITRSFDENGTALLSKMKSVSAGLIGDNEMMQTSMRGIVEGLSGDQMTKLLEIARVGSRLTGKDMTESFEGVTKSILSMKERGLKELGIYIDKDNAFETYAKKMGISTDEMTRGMKVQAFYTAVLEDGERKLASYGDMHLTAAEKMKRMQVSIHETKEAAGKAMIATKEYLGSYFDALSMKFMSGIMSISGNVSAGNQLAVAAEQSQFYDAKKYMDNLRKYAGDVAGRFSPGFGAEQDTKIRESIADAAGKRLREEKEQRERQAILLKKLTDASREYSAVIKDIGVQELAMAGNNLKEHLADQAHNMRAVTVEYQNLSDAIKTGFDLEKQITRLDDISSAFRTFGDIVDGVYSEQITKQREVVSALKRYGADFKDITKQSIDLTQTEIKHNQARLSNYQQYYAELKKLQQGYYDTMAKSAADIAALDRRTLAIRRSTSQVLTDMWEKANPAKNEIDQWNRDYAKIQHGMALTASLPLDEQVDALKALQKEAMGLIRQVDYKDIERRLVRDEKTGSTDFADVEVDRTFMSMQRSYEIAQNMALQMHDRMIQIQAQTRDEMASNWTRASEGLTSVSEAIKLVNNEMITVQNSLVSLDQLLAQKRELVIDISKTMDNIAKVTTSLPMTTTVSPPPVLDQFASGTPYVPKTGLYQLHKGEAVIPADRNSGGGGITITGGITINTTGGNPDIIARDLVKAVEREQRKMRAIGA